MLKKCYKTMAKNFKYLKTISSRRLRLRRMAILLIVFQFIAVFLYCVIMGTTLRESLLTKLSYVPTVKDNTNSENLSKQSEKMHGYHAINSSSTNHSSNEKKSPPIYKGLPEKYLKNYPPKKPAALFPNIPWKYIKRMETKNQTYFITFLIKSACPFVERRFLIRCTWGSIAKINSDSFAIIFLLGMTRNQEQQSIIDQENKMYGDILQSDVADNYFSLPQKVLASFQWLTYDVGPTSQYFITTDDDCAINIPTVYDYYRFNMNKLKDKINCGFIYDKGSRPIRKKNHKWGVSYETYPDDAYPAFCHGAMIAWPYSAIKKIYLTSETTNITGMHLEDVLISGILRDKTYNSLNSLGPRIFREVRGKYRGPEPFVYHLGPREDLRKSFAIQWHYMKPGLRLGKADPMIGKQISAYKFNATLFTTHTLPDKNLNETVNFFKSFWSKYYQRKSPTHNKENNETQVKIEVYKQDSIKIN